MTAVAIISTLLLSIALYYIYSIFFSFVVGIVASYDYRFGEGFGALALLLILPYGLAFFGASLISFRLIPSAEPMGIRYGVIAVVVIFSLLVVLGDIVSQHQAKAIVIAVTLVTSIIGVVAGTSPAIRPRQKSSPKGP